MLTLGGEWGFPVSRQTKGALFVEARAGEGDFHGIYGGLRFYFGNHEKSLMRRNREDDPPADQNLNLFTLGGATGQQSVPQAPTQHAPPPPACPPVSGPHLGADARGFDRRSCRQSRSRRRRIRLRGRRVVSMMRAPANCVESDVTAQMRHASLPPRSRDRPRAPRSSGSSFSHRVPWPEAAVCRLLPITPLV